jgi:hypothetical protein
MENQKFQKNQKPTETNFVPTDGGQGSGNSASEGGEKGEKKKKKKKKKSAEDTAAEEKMSSALSAVRVIISVRR